MVLPAECTGFREHLPLCQKGSPCYTWKWPLSRSLVAKAVREKEKFLCLLEWVCLIESMQKCI